MKPWFFCDFKYYPKSLKINENLIEIPQDAQKISRFSPSMLTTLDFFISNLGFCLEHGLLNSETEISTGVA